MLPVKQILDEIVSDYSAILKENFVGIYLHGSLAMDCYNPDSSDIDFLVVVKEKPAFHDLRGLIDVLINLSEDGPEKGFEMSVLLEEDAKNFRYPTPFVLHYSNLYKDKYIKQPDFICSGSEDPDLAAHITVLRKRGKCLVGQPINEVFQPVPEKYYIDSIKSDVISSREEITGNPVYYILNLCRVLYFLRDGEVCSKKEGGEWALSNLPSQYTDVIEAALNTYNDVHKTFDIQQERSVDFADFMLKLINK